LFLLLVEVSRCKYSANTAGSYATYRFYCHIWFVRPKIQREFSETLINDAPQRPRVMNSEQ
jgi:hypothetical protein